MLDVRSSSGTLLLQERHQGFSEICSWISFDFKLITITKTLKNGWNNMMGVLSGKVLGRF